MRHHKMRHHKTGAALLALAVVPLVGGAAASAAIPAGINGPGLSAVGPVSTTDGFPVWYRDKTGLRLENCIAQADPMCPARGPLPDETAPISFPDNYPDEGFYMAATANLSTANGGSALAAVDLEQAFRSGPVVAGDQITFARVRLKITNAVDGVTYRITSPAGVRDVQTSKPGLVFDTEDIGIGGSGDFSGALGGRVGPFLTWDTFPADPALKPDAAGKDSYIGDGTTPHKIKGSPYDTNLFRIEGPGVNPSPTVDACPTIAGPVADCIQTDLFTLQGKLATTGGVTAEQATYSRSSPGSGLLDVYASALVDSSRSIQVTDANPTAASREFSTTGLTGDKGHYFARVSYTGAQPPPRVQVSNTGDVPVTNKLIDVVDRLTGTATYDTDTEALTVNAVSSDTASPPVLTAAGYGPLVGGSLVDTVAAPPVTVAVSSAAGGSLTLPVVITGGARAAIAVTAQAGPDQSAVTGQVVTLDGTASGGDVATFAWVSPAGISLSDPTRAAPTFTAPAAGTYTFTLTVTGPGGPSTSSVVVTVSAASAAVADAGPAQTVRRGTPVILNGSASTGAAIYTWTQVVGVGDPVVTLAKADTARPTFTFPLYRYPAANGALTFQLVVSNSQGASTPALVKITPTSDAVAITAARYTANKNQWRVDGTSSILAGQSITVHLGALSGQVLGTAVVSATGTFTMLSSPTVVGRAGQTVSVESSLGGTAAGFPLRVG